MNFFCFWKNQIKFLDQKIFRSVEELANSIWSLAEDNIYSQSKEHYLEFCKSIFSKHFDFEEKIFNVLFISHKENKIIGFLTASIVYEKVDIDYIYVKQSERRHGIGLQLFKLLEQKLYAESLRTHFNYQILLEVSENNAPALQFYESLGFWVLEKRKKYYKNGDTALIMQKLLENHL